MSCRPGPAPRPSARGSPLPGGGGDPLPWGLLCPGGSPLWPSRQHAAPTWPGGPSRRGRAGVGAGEQLAAEHTGPRGVVFPQSGQTRRVPCPSWSGRGRKRGCGPPGRGSPPMPARHRPRSRRYPGRPACPPGPHLKVQGALRVSKHSGWSPSGRPAPSLTAAAPGQEVPPESAVSAVSSFCGRRPHASRERSQGESRSVPVRSGSLLCLSIEVKTVALTNDFSSYLL